MTSPPAITGLGVVTAGARGAESFARLLRTGRGHFRVAKGRIVAPLGDIDLDTELARLTGPDTVLGKARVLRRFPASCAVSVLAAVQAFLHSGLATGTNPERVAVVVAGDNIQPAYSASARATPDRVPPSYAVQFWDSSLVGVASSVLPIRGAGLTVGAASASGAVAIVEAARLLRDGQHDACLVIGALTRWSETEFAGFEALGALAKNNWPDPALASRPFDRGHAGFVPGEAAAALVLEPAAHAAARGARAHGRLLGEAQTLDGGFQPDPDSAGQVRTMRLALARAGLAPGDVGYVNAHATSTPKGDLSEAQAIREVFGTGPHVNATKALVGHCMSAAGVLETVAAVIQLRDGFLHANPHLEAPVLDGVNFVRREVLPTAARVAVKNAYAFGGINASLVLGAPGNEEGRT